MTGVLKEHDVDDVAMRDAYCQSLIGQAEQNNRIVAVEVDVMNSMGTVPFSKRFPNRSVNCGIMEANAVGVCAGLSVTGYLPFFHAFGVFATRRCYDQIFVSGAYAGCDIKIIGGDSGVTAAFNGGTHMPFEDIGIMRDIPGITIVEPADTTAVRQMVGQIAQAPGIHYMRSCRKNVRRIYRSDAKLKIGSGQLLREGKDLTVFACGIMVHEALIAAEILATEGVETRVVDMFTIKPIDSEMVIQAAFQTGAIVTAENHSIINGLGSAVCEVVSENCPVPVERVGVDDRFGQVGSMEQLMQEYGLTSEAIVEKARQAVRRKQNRKERLA